MPRTTSELSDPETRVVRRVFNLRNAASIAFAVILLWIAFQTLGVNLGRTWQLIAGAQVGFLVLAFLAYYLTFPIRALRWRYVLSTVDTPIRFRDALEILFLSWFVNCLVPAKLGDLYRAYLLRTANGASAPRTLGTIFIERVADIVVIFALALAAGFWSFRNTQRAAVVDTLYLAGFVIATIVVVLVVILRWWGAHLSKWLPARIAQLWDRFHEGSTGTLVVKRLPMLGAMTVAIWLLEGARLYFVIRALEMPGVHLGISASIFVALATALLTAIPLTPAGIGFVEAGIAGALLLYGVSGDQGVAVALTDRAISILSVILIGGVVYALSSKVRRTHAAGGGREAPSASGP